jgi:hypothetical protein
MPMHLAHLLPNMLEITQEHLPQRPSLDRARTRIVGSRQRPNEALPFPAV